MQLDVLGVGLIGGGTSPKDADALVTAYAVARPIAEIFPLSVAVVEKLWFGAGKREQA